MCCVVSAWHACSAWLPAIIINEAPPKKDLTKKPNQIIESLEKLPIEGFCDIHVLF